MRAELARAVVAKGCDLLGLTQAGMSLEEIFLHLTTTDAAHGATSAPPRTHGGDGMTALRNVAAIVREGVAPLLRQPHRLRGPRHLDAAVRRLLLLRLQPSSCSTPCSPRSRWSSAAAPKLSLNEMRDPAACCRTWPWWRLFITPMLTMRLFAEEKRQGTIELLATAPITDLQIVLGKFLGALGLYALMIAGRAR